MVNGFCVGLSGWRFLPLIIKDFFLIEKQKEFLIISEIGRQRLSLLLNDFLNLFED